MHCCLSIYIRACAAERSRGIAFLVCRSGAVVCDCAVVPVPAAAQPATAQQAIAVPRTQGVPPLSAISYEVSNLALLVEMCSRIKCALTNFDVFAKKGCLASDHHSFLRYGERDKQVPNCLFGSNLGQQQNQNQVLVLLPWLQAHSHQLHRIVSQQRPDHAVSHHVHIPLAELLRRPAGDYSNHIRHMLLKLRELGVILCKLNEAALTSR